MISFLLYVLHLSSIVSSSGNGVNGAPLQPMQMQRQTGAPGGGQEPNDEMMQGDEVEGQEENVWLASQFFDKVGYEDLLLLCKKSTAHHGFRPVSQFPDVGCGSLSILYTAALILPLLYHYFNLVPFGHTLGRPQTLFTYHINGLFPVWGVSDEDLHLIFDIRDHFLF